MRRRVGVLLVWWLPSSLLWARQGCLAFHVPTKTTSAARQSQRRFLPTTAHRQQISHLYSNEKAVDEKNQGSSATDPSATTKEEEFYIEIGYQEYFDGTKPDAAWNLAKSNFVRQGKTILQQGLEIVGISKRDPKLPPDSLGLELSNEAVMKAERRREAKGGKVDAHPVSRTLYEVGCYFLDNLYDGRPIARFWFLETIARIPYFSYVSMLHLYESFGWFRAVELRKVHSAEDWNELHHLLIMESLGGNALWSDRFLGYHIAFLYYWALVSVYLCSPRIAYQFMALLEAHAVDTYATFCRQNEERLKSLPPPTVAESYYKTGDLYLFDDFQVSRVPGSRRPPCDNLYDVFSNIAIDEGEHVKTMIACQEYAISGNQVVSPHLNFKVGDTLAVDPEEELKRQQWKDWSDSVNEQSQFPGEMDGY